jgi:hypothetical protein
MCAKQEVSKYMTYTRCELEQLKRFLSLYHSTERQLHFPCKKTIQLLHHPTLSPLQAAIFLAVKRKDHKIKLL